MTVDDHESELCFQILITGVDQGAVIYIVSRIKRPKKAKFNMLWT